MNVTSVDFTMDTLPVRQSSAVSIGRIKPELYKQKSVDSEEGNKEPVETCGKLSFALKYDYEEQALVVRILKALDLPAKDFTGTSDPYVKIYLLPERKKKFQTRVHRKTLNPTFDEVFCFPVEYDQLCNRKLHFSVYDFDRFTSHDMIGEVVVDNLFELSDLSREAVVWKDILASTTVSIVSFLWIVSECGTTWFLKKKFKSSRLLFKIKKKNTSVFSVINDPDHSITGKPLCQKLQPTSTNMARGEQDISLTSELICYAVPGVKEGWAQNWFTLLDTHTPNPKRDEISSLLCHGELQTLDMTNAADFWLTMSTHPTSVL